jgi:hypothetical protein
MNLHRREKLYTHEYNSFNMTLVLSPVRQIYLQKKP